MEQQNSTDKASTDSSESTTVISIPKGPIAFNPSLFGSTLRDGFAALYKDESLSDITLVLGEEKIPAHRLVLCAWSDTFRAMLARDSNWKESGEKELKVNVEEEDYPNFKIMLEYMYTGKADAIDDYNVVPLLILCNYYGVHALKEVCGGLLGAQLSEGNLHFLLDLIDKYDCKQLEQSCGEFLAVNFEEMWLDDPKRILTLRPATWEAILRSDDLAMSSEQKLYELVVEYSKQFADKRDEVLELLLPKIRFSHIDIKFMAEVVEKDETLKHLQVLHKILLDCYRYKAYPNILPTTYSTAPRTGIQTFDETSKGSQLTLSEGRTKVDSSSLFGSAGWQSVRVTVPFSSSYCYCEFKFPVVANAMVGVVFGNPQPNGYAGQHANAYTVNNSDGSLYSASTAIPQAGGFGGSPSAWHNGDIIGVGYNKDKGEMYFYKNSTKVLTHNIPWVQPQGALVYAVVSLAGNTTVTLVPSPRIPADLPLPEGYQGRIKSKKNVQPQQQDQTPGWGADLPPIQNAFDSADWGFAAAPSLFGAAGGFSFN